MTFALGVNPQYQNRMPTVADFLHMLVPHMWPLAYETNETVNLEHIQRIGKNLKNFNPIFHSTFSRFHRNSKIGLTFSFLRDCNRCV